MDGSVMRRARRWLGVGGVVLACLLGLVGTGVAQQSWPPDEAGVPAPPCTYYDPVANTIKYCNPTTPLPVTTTPPGTTAFGLGWFTRSDPQSTPTRPAGNFLFLNETTVVGVGGNCAGNTLRIYQSLDGGNTVTALTTAPSGAGCNAVNNLVRSANGLYVVGVNSNPQSIQASRDLGSFTLSAGNGIPGGAGNTILYQAGNTFILTEDATNTVCRNTAPATGATFPGAWTCVTPATWTGPITGGSTLGAFEIAPSTAAGGAGGVWIGVDKATPNANVVRSVDDGVTWAAVTTLAEGTAGQAHSIVCLRNALATCLIALNGKLYRSTDSGATWTLVATFTYANLGHAFVDFGQNTLVVVGSFVDGATTPPPGCQPTCTSPTLTWVRSTDAGVTWVPIGGGWGETGGAGTQSVSMVSTSPTTGRSILSNILNAGNAPGGANPSRGYVFNPVIPPGGTAIFGNGALPLAVLDHGEVIQAGPVQAGKLLNSQTTGGAIAAVTVTLTGVTGFRVHVYSVEARCNTAAATTTGVTMTDAATTVWSTGPSDVPAASVNYGRPWVPAYTAGDGASVVITLAACSAGTGTLIVQADQF